MGLDFSGDILTINLDAVSTLALAALLLLLGGWIKKKFPVFERICFPTPVIGGGLFALLNLILLKSNLVNVNLATTYQSDFMLIFFTIVGFGASLALVKKGGGKLILYFLITGILLGAQGFVGMISAKLAGVSGVYGIVCGPMSMAGGHGSVASYGSMLETAGHSGIMVVGMAAATFGVISGSMLGGPLCDRLVKRHKLVNTDASILPAHVNEAEMEKAESNRLSLTGIIFHIALITSFLAVGKLIGTTLGGFFDVSLPGFVGPMLVAFIVRNIDDQVKWLKVDNKFLDKFSDLALSIFLSMSIMSLKLWELLDLAIPMLIILIIQVIFTLIVVYFLVFRILGSNFDAAAMCAGLIGHGFGATPNAVANLEGVAEKYGRSRMAFLIVPIVGGFLQDVIAVPLMVYFVNLFI